MGSEPVPKSSAAPQLAVFPQPPILIGLGRGLGPVNWSLGMSAWDVQASEYLVWLRQSSPHFLFFAESHPFSRLTKIPLYGSADLSVVGQCWTLELCPPFGETEWCSDDCMGATFSRPPVFNAVGDSLPF